MTPPGPPADIDQRHPLLRQLAVGDVLYRFHTRSFAPIHFDKSTGGRLNAPDGSYGVLYLANTARGAFAETFLRQPGRTLLPPDMIASKALAIMRATQVLRVVRLHGNGLARLGCTAEVTHGGLPYDLPQAWSRALHAHPSRPNGIEYHARHDDDELCYAIFDDEHVGLPVEQQEPNLNQDWFYELFDYYGVGLAPPS